MSGTEIEKRHSEIAKKLAKLKESLPTLQTCVVVYDDGACEVFSCNEPPNNVAEAPAGAATPIAPSPASFTAGPEAPGFIFGGCFPPWKC